MYKFKHGTLFFFSLVVGISMSFNNINNWLLWTLLLTFIISLIGILFKSEHYTAYQQSTGIRGFCKTYLLLSWIQNTIVAAASYYGIKLLIFLWG